MPGHRMGQPTMVELEPPTWPRFGCIFCTSINVSSFGTDNWIYTWNNLPSRTRSKRQVPSSLGYQGGEVSDGTKEEDDDLRWNDLTFDAKLDFTVPLVTVHGLIWCDSGDDRW